MPTLGSITRHAAIAVSGAAIVLVPALANGYPFVYSDTGTYVRSAFAGFVPVDRPFWYGPFVWAASLDGFSLWGVAVVQALICSAYLLRVCKLVQPIRAVRIFFVACAVLTMGSGLGWYAGRLIPDVFTGIGMLAVYLLLHGRSAWWCGIIDGSVIVAACWTHTSNLLILPIAGVLLLFMARRDGTAMIRRSAARLGAITVVAWAGLAVANKSVGGEAYIARGSHVFLMGRMLDLGMLGPYLDEHCPTQHLAICAFKDSLPRSGQAFLFSGQSPLALQGGWAATKEEYGRIVRGSLAEPRYLWWHVRGSLTSTAGQLCAWEICGAMRSDWYRAPDSPPYTAIAELLPHELPSYLGALQNGGRSELDMVWPDRLYRVVLALSLLAAAWIVSRRQRDLASMETRSFLAFAIMAIVIGAWICASLSMVDPRYLARDSWLLPFAVLLTLLRDPHAGRQAPSPTG